MFGLEHVDEHWARMHTSSTPKAVYLNDIEINPMAQKGIKRDIII